MVSMIPCHRHKACTVVSMPGDEYYEYEHEHEHGVAGHGELDDRESDNEGNAAAGSSASVAPPRSALFASQGAGATGVQSQLAAYKDRLIGAGAAPADFRLMICFA